MNSLFAIKGKGKYTNQTQKSWVVVLLNERHKIILLRKDIYNMNFNII